MSCRKQMQQLEAVPPLPAPVPFAVRFQDPRLEREKDVGIVGFYYPGKDEPWDRLCGAGFLGNFWPLGAGALQLEAPTQPGRTVSFTNAEAAFQALKFWSRADEFSMLSGNAAFRLKRSLRGQEDFTYGGFGSNWAGMNAVLEAKFRPGTPLAMALLSTGDAFLLEHNSVMGRDKIWSNNADGEGTNWLGMQLMLLRDQLAGQNRWMHFIASRVDYSTGQPLGPEQAAEWQQAVRGATRALKATLARLREEEEAAAAAAAAAEAAKAAKAAQAAKAAEEAAAAAAAAAAAPEAAEAAEAAESAGAAEEAAAAAAAAKAARAAEEVAAAAAAAEKAQGSSFQDGGELPTLPALPAVVRSKAPPELSALEMPPSDGAGPGKEVAVFMGPRIPGLATGDLPDLPDLPEIQNINLVNTKLRAPLSRKFTFMGDKDEKQIPVLMTLVANQRRPPPEPEPVEEPEEADPEPVQFEPEELTSAEIYVKLIREEGDDMNTLDFAAMGRLRAWDTCAEGYSVHEMMNLVRWLEGQLAPPEPKLPLWRRLLFELDELTQRTRVRLAIGVFVAVMLWLIMFSAFTGWAMNVTRVASTRPDGLITIEGLSGEQRLAGVGAAVHHHSLLDCASLRTEDLRRMQDVGLRHQGDFHVYHVAGVTQVLGGGVRILAEDGTLIRVRGHDVTIARPWAKEEVVDPSGLTGSGTGAALRALVAPPFERAS